jgi:hypothetical protein
MEKEVPKQSTKSSSSGTNSTEGKTLIRTSVEASKFHTDCQKEHEASLDCEPTKCLGFYRFRFVQFITAFLKYYMV